MKNGINKLSLNSERGIVMNEVLKVIKSRRSIRSYREEQISQESLDLIIEAGIYAPAANNEQWRRKNEHNN